MLTGKGREIPPSFREILHKAVSSVEIMCHAELSKSPHFSSKAAVKLRKGGVSCPII